ncbi:MAG: MarC family protein [Myxococcales bacterium]|nr:MarC family protein [Myxococcales bacterium]
MVAELSSAFFVAFSAVLVVVEPFGVAPTFAALTAGRSPAEVHRIAARATLAGAGVLVAFTLVGGHVLDALHLRLDAFRAAGGLLLLLTALQMLQGDRNDRRCSPGELVADREDVAIVPIAVPLLAGPGSMATVMVLVAEGGTAQVVVVLAAVLATFAVTYGVLRVSARLSAWAGPSGIAVVRRVLGLLLAALAMQFVAGGLAGLFGWVP